MNAYTLKYPVLLVRADGGVFTARAICGTATQSNDRLHPMKIVVHRAYTIGGDGSPSEVEGLGAPITIAIEPSTIATVQLDINGKGNP
jgi:hypothetical protein